MRSMEMKLVGLIVAVVAVLGLSGCGSSSDDHYQDDLVTLFLVDELGYSYGGVPYICDSMRDWEVTLPNGEFTFLPPDNCEFDFLGLDGNLFNDPRVDDIVRIVDFTDDGKGGIPYECASFSGVDETRFDGSFEYDIDDQCVFYL
jgi:hypothetical protein